MPKLGMEVPDRLIADTRIGLMDRFKKSSVLASVSGLFFLHRTAYTGDYLLEGYTCEKGYFPIANFAMLPMPGCRAVCVFHHSMVHESLRGRRIGKELLRIREEVAKEVGYKRVLATVRYDNEVEYHLLKSAGWTYMFTFRNDQTGHNVLMFSKEL